MSDEHPLRWVITCSDCKRKFTSRNTSKMVWPKWNKKKKLYPFYWCNNKDCNNRMNVKKDTLEQEFTQFLTDMTLPKGILALISTIFDQAREESKKDKSKIKWQKQKEIKALEKRQTQIEDILPQTQNLKLYQKLEEERATLDSKIEIMTNELESNTHSDTRKKALLQKTQHLFEDPLSIRELGNQTMRWLLVTVRFGDTLFYTKKEWLKTVWNGTLFSIYRDLSNLFPSNIPRGIRTPDLCRERAVS